MGELTDPVANGMYFNHVNDFKNSGLGITGNSFCALFLTQLVAPVTGNYKFRLTNSDDNSWIWFDFDGDGNYSRSGTNGDELLGNANQEFGPQTFTSNEIMMEAGKSYGLAMISSNYGGGGTFRPWIELPGGTMEIMNPHASSQSGMYQVIRLSNGQSMDTQTSLETNMTGLVPGSSYFYRVMATNSLGNFWANTSDSFIASHPLDFSANGSLTIMENQPVGSLVGELNTIDTDTNASITYSLVSGSGDQHNALFSVDANGTMTSNAIFDYENNAFTFSILVRATSDTNASYEKALTINMGNQIETPPPMDSDANFHHCDKSMVPATRPTQPQPTAISATGMCLALRT